MIQLYTKIYDRKKRKDEEEKYEEITKGDNGLYRVSQEGKEAILTLTMYKNEAYHELT